MLPPVYLTTNQVPSADAFNEFNEDEMKDVWVSAEELANIWLSMEAMAKKGFGTKQNALLLSHAQKVGLLFQKLHVDF